MSRQESARRLTSDQERHLVEPREARERGRVWRARGRIAESAGELQSVSILAQELPD